MSEEANDPNAGYNFLWSVPEAMMEDHYSALGKFFWHFGRLEQILKQEVYMMVFGSLKHEPGSYAIARSVVKLATVGPAMGALKHILKVIETPPDVRDEVERILKQVTEIQYLRDRLAHNFSRVDVSNREGWFCVNNQITAKDSEQLEAVYFKTETLNNMVHDLSAMPLLLSLALRPEDYEPDAFTQNGLSRTWRYKPSQLKKTGPRHDRTLQARSNRPQSSPESPPG